LGRGIHQFLTALKLQFGDLAAQAKEFDIEWVVRALCAIVASAI
jgi:hypothetical protein